ncbi:LETM1 domain-containing protein 1 isoform 2-T2 [Mantella aurantiaca]
MRLAYNMALYRTRMDGGDRRLVKCLITLYQPCHLSTSQKPQSVLSTLTSKARHLNARYERFLERKFPNFYILYSTFMKGFRMLLMDGREVLKIKKNMRSQGLKYYQLPYRDMEKLRQFRRDIIKAAPVMIISIPPFANYLVFVLMYFFPRQMLIWHFWTPKQQEEFLEIYHNMRKEVYEDVLESLQIAASKVSKEPVHSRMVQLFTQVQQGVHPLLKDIEGIKAAFSDPPLCMTELEIPQMACYIRGLNSSHLGTEACRRWLSCWIQLSGKLKVSEASLLLHSMVLLSTNYQQFLKD